MRTILLAFFLYSSLAGFSQPGNKMAPKDQRRKLITDSGFIQLKKIQDSVKTVRPYEEQKQWESNLDALIQIQKEQRARQKRAAIIRIGIGIALFIVLLVGLNRRRGKVKKGV
jgi:hypothetical protein